MLARESGWETNRFCWKEPGKAEERERDGGKRKYTARSCRGEKDNLALDLNSKMNVIVRRR